VLAPAAVPVFVIEPALQPVHDATFDCSEYVAGPHRLQVLAPAAVPVSVIEPAAQVAQSTADLTLMYFPAAQSWQLVLCT
jgi:hypothetical protein